MRGKLLTVAVLVLSAACRRERDEDRESAERPDPGELRVAPGESLWIETGDGKPVVWRPAGAEPVLLYVVRTGENRGVLRAKQGDRESDVLPFTVRPGLAPRMDIRPGAGERATFHYGPTAEGEEKRPRAIALLDWDREAKQVKVVKRWRGFVGEKEPAWVRSGRTDLEGTALASCETVVQKIAACAQEGGDGRRFKDLLFRKLGGDERDRALRALENGSSRWKDAGEARQQCQSWAGAGFDGSALTEPEEVRALAKEAAELPCELFARELDDEGGLPRQHTASR